MCYQQNRKQTSKITDVPNTLIRPITSRKEGLLQSAGRADNESGQQAIFTPSNNSEAVRGSPLRTLDYNTRHSPGPLSGRLPQTQAPRLPRGASYIPHSGKDKKAAAPKWTEKDTLLSRGAPCDVGPFLRYFFDRSKLGIRAIVNHECRRFLV